jgi:hypothetical protein
MKKDNSLIENLLYGEEGVDLDFKRDQYKFLKASDDEKGELLKDILSFANSWRRSDAFILIGIEEVKGGRSNVYGISDKFDDAQIQQFVNSKTNRPITFSYQNIDFEGKCIGIFHIPVQIRPIYLKKDFGKLKKETVYIKRGSSTEIAKLDEIAKMGNSLYQIEQSQPVLEVFFANLEERVLLSNIYQISSLNLKTPKKKDIPDYELPSSERPDLMSFTLERANYSYYRKLADFIKQHYLYTPVNFAIKNTGPSVAKDVRIEFKISDKNNVIKAIDKGDLLSAPKASYSSFNSPLFYPKSSVNSTEYLNVKRISDYWLIEAGVKKVQPKSVTWLENTLFLGAIKSLGFPIETTMYSDDLPEPSVKNLIVKVNSEERDATLEDIKELESERFRNSNEYKEFKERHFNERD